MFSIFLAFLYIFIITHFLTAWNEIEEWEFDDQFKPDTFLSIIIPFRNESGNIQTCIESVLRCRYPKNLFEIIAVDDFSQDKGGNIAESIHSEQVRIISLDKIFNSSDFGGKKNAISEGIMKSKGDLIITLDADCRVQKDWLKSTASFYEYYKIPMIVGMVSLIGSENIMESFQIMDTCGTMGIHGAGIHNRTHFLANGANFIFEKNLYLEMDPFTDNEQFASGDDIFFINKVADKDPGKIGFLKSKEHIVETESLVDWGTLWNQRKRWAGKTRGYSKGIFLWMTGFIWILLCTVIINLLLIPFTQGLSLFIALTQLFIVAIMDFLYLQNMCAYFGKRKYLKYFIPSFFIHKLYILTAGYFALRGSKYRWKGRDLS